MPGAPWVAHEWLSEAFIAFIYDHFGWAGLVVMVAAVFAAALTLLAVYLSRDIGEVAVGHEAERHRIGRVDMAAESASQGDAFGRRRPMALEEQFRARV